MNISVKEHWDTNRTRFLLMLFFISVKGWMLLSSNRSLRK